MENNNLELVFKQWEKTEASNKNDILDSIAINYMAIMYYINLNYMIVVCHLMRINIPYIAFLLNNNFCFYLITV
jgi:hypothetical protein